MTRCESYPPCFGTIYFPTAPSFSEAHRNALHNGLHTYSFSKSATQPPPRRPSLSTIE